MKPILFLSMLVIYLQASSTTYKPTTLSLNQITVGAVGDSVLLSRGSTYTGTLSCHSGVIYAAWGTGAAPIIQGKFILSCNNVHVYELNFYDARMSPTDRSQQALIDIGVDISSQNCLVRKCSFSLIGGAFLITGSFNTVDSCTISNLRMIKNTVGGDDDFGAAGFVISGHDNNILSNNVSGCWAISEDYTFDGGFTDYYGGGSSNNKMMWNVISDCNGTLEFGSGNGGISDNNLFAYNTVINDGELAYVNSNGQYTVSVTNLQVYNNIIIENKTNFTGQSSLIGYGGASSLLLKNNIFNLTGSGIDVARSGLANFTHTNNLYKFGSGSTTNFTLTPTEINTTQSIFTNTISSDPLNWNYYPLPTSPAINSGLDVGITRDIVNFLVSPPVTIGNRQYSTALSLPTSEPLFIPMTVTPYVYYEHPDLTFNSQRMDDYFISDVLGRKVESGKTRIGWNRINLEGLTVGVYVIKTYFYSYKFFKNR